MWAKIASKLRSWFGKQDAFVSIVLLLREPRKIGQEALRDAAERAWNLKLETGNDAKNFALVQANLNFIKVDDHFFQILRATRPYVTDAEAVRAHFSDDLVWTAIVAHKAWLSVDYMASADCKLSEDARYAATGKLIAEFVDANCLAICLPDKDLIVPATPAAVKILRNMNTPWDLDCAFHHEG